MPSDWTRTETYPAPERIRVSGTLDSGQEFASEGVAQPKSTSQINYTTIEYTDQNGDKKREDVAEWKEDLKWHCLASVNPMYAADLFKYYRNSFMQSWLVSVQEKTVTVYFYRIGNEGLYLQQELVHTYMTLRAFAGQLQGILYSWPDPSGLSQRIVYEPSDEMVLVRRVEIRHEQTKTANGRDITRTTTASSVAAGLTPEGKTEFQSYMKSYYQSSGTSSASLNGIVYGMTTLKYEGADVQVSIGRMPVPTRPSDPDAKASEVVNGQDPVNWVSNADRYGNEVGWTAYVPPGIDPQTLNRDTNSDGVPDWAPYVPSQWQTYNQDSNGDGTPDWAAYVPSVSSWQSYVTNPSNWQNTAIDSNNDGVPDWADLTPIGWPDFSTKDSDYTNPEPEVNNDHFITGRVVFDGEYYDDGDPTVTATYEMPYAPDDHWMFFKRVRKLTRSGARYAAERFGRTEAALDIGHAFGQNIVTGFNEIPTLDLSPIYLRIAGLETAFLTDSLSYAWGPEGMVVSSDLMLVGVTGYYGSTPPSNSWIRLPIPSTSVGPAGGTTIEASPVKANSINIPTGFNVRNLAPVFALLPTNGADVFPEWRDNTSLVPPVLVLESLSIATGPVVVLQEFDYPMTLEPEAAVLATGGFVQNTPPSTADGTAAPILGATQVSPTTAATGNGWTLVFDGTADDNSTSISGFGFAFTLSGTAYTGCAVSSNSYITFGGSQDVYQNLSASNPSLPKLLIAAGDFSYQRIYTKAVAGAFRIRYEGNSNRSASAGSSDRFLEVAFYEALESGAQFLEVRSGNVGGNLSGPFMLATASTELASEVFAENESWVFQGNAAGTTWSVQSAKHVTGAAS